MEHLPEFVMNHPLLWGGLVIVLAMLIKSEYEHQTSKASQLNPVNAIRLMNNNDNAIVIDVRDTAEYKKGHIKNAKNMPLSTLKDKLDELARHKDQAVLAYCSSGALSNKACSLLQKAGFSNVHNISGGINGWVDAKLPTTKK